MRKIPFIFFVLCLTSIYAMDSAFDMAEYYLQRQDYKQAFDLFSKNPTVAAAVRVAELKFLLQGRSAARDALVTFIEKNEKILSDESRDHTISKLENLLEKFVTDEGQSDYFRAVTRIRHGDWNTALNLLDNAMSREDGNTRILELKSICERETKKNAEYMKTLEMIKDRNPYSLINSEKLAEVYVFHGEYTKALEALASIPEEDESDYVRLLYSISDVETRAKNLDLGELEELSVTYPIANFYLAKELARRGTDKNAARLSLSKFLSVPAPTDEKWDPFKLSERRVEAKKLFDAYPTGIQ